MVLLAYYEGQWDLCWLCCKYISGAEEENKMEDKVDIAGAHLGPIQQNKREKFKNWTPYFSKTVSSCLHVSLNEIICVCASAENIKYNLWELIDLSSPSVIWKNDDNVLLILCWPLRVTKTKQNSAAELRTLSQAVWLWSNINMTALFSRTHSASHVWLLMCQFDVRHSLWDWATPTSVWVWLSISRSVKLLSG